AGSDRACRGSSASSGPPGRLRARGTRTARGRRATAPPTPRRGRPGRADRDPPTRSASWLACTPSTGVARPMPGSTGLVELVGHECPGDDTAVAGGNGDLADRDRAAALDDRRL